MDEEYRAMDQSFPHIVIAEHEFLIALDAEYLIRSAIDCRTTLVRPEQLGQWNPAALADVDLCLIDVPLDMSGIAPAIQRLVDAGVPLLLTTVSEAHQKGVAGFETLPIATKPFEADTLLAMVRAQLHRAAQPAEDADQN